MNSLTFNDVLFCHSILTPVSTSLSEQEQVWVKLI